LLGRATTSYWLRPSSELYAMRTQPCSWWFWAGADRIEDRREDAMQLIERSLNWFPPWAILCSVGFCLADLTQASAADSETRDFTISIDGKKAGECHVTFCRQDNGQLTVSGQADVKVNYLVYSYTYSFRGIE